MGPFLVDGALLQADTAGERGAMSGGGQGKVGAAHAGCTPEEWSVKMGLSCLYSSLHAFRLKKNCPSWKSTLFIDFCAALLNVS